MSLLDIHKNKNRVAAFDITESVQNSGFVKVFKSHETKRVTLKARSQERMVDWCVIVNGADHTA